MNDELLNINIVGDFFCPRLNGLEFSDALNEKLEHADLNVVNFEGPIKINKSVSICKSGPNISQDPDAPVFLKEHGFKLFSLANNHSMDYGEQALDATIDCLNEVCIVGAGLWHEAYKIKILEIRGKKIGFLAITQFEFGVLDDTVFCKNKKGAAWVGHPCIDKLIVESKQQCDYLVVLPHAGLEHFTQPLPELLTLYRHFIDMGADAVIGAHPHVPQPWETYKNKPIVYSLGNFCFDRESKKSLWSIGLLANLTFDDYEVNLQIHPLHFDSNSRTVEIINDAKINSILDESNKLFSNESAYVEAVNNQCLSMQSYYDMLLEMSGYSKFSIKHSLGYIKRKLLGKVPTTDNSHFINCVRCETHRWVLSRIYELNNIVKK